MRKLAYALAIACLVSLGGLASINVHGMGGTGSPSRDCGNIVITPTAGPCIANPPGVGSSLRNPADATAVFYGTGPCIAQPTPTNPFCVPRNWAQGTLCTGTPPAQQTKPCAVTPAPAPNPAYFAWDPVPGYYNASHCAHPTNPSACGNRLMAATDVTCVSSPSCIPAWPFDVLTDPRPKISSAFYGTPAGPASQSGATCAANYSPGPCYTNYRLPNPCIEADPASLVVTQTDPTPVKPTWSPIESIHGVTAFPNTYPVYGSIGYTAFVAPTYNPPLYNNPYNPSDVVGTGRFHLDGQRLVTDISETIDNNTLTTVFVSEGDPHDAEDIPDKRYALLGHDGYLLGNFAQPVQNGPGYDIRVATVTTGQPYGTFCLYGSGEGQPTGPFTLVHSAFVDSQACNPGSSFYYTDTVDTSGDRHADDGVSDEVGCPDYPASTEACPQGTTCWGFDLDLFYKPLREALGVPDPADLKYFLIVNSIQHTPYLKTDFTSTPNNSEECIDPRHPDYDPTRAASGACTSGPCALGNLTCDPVTGHLGTYPNPLRNYQADTGTLFEFDDTSMRFGYPMWQRLDPVAGLVHNAADIRDDPIDEYDWNFEGDACGYPSDETQKPGQVAINGDPVDQPPYYTAGNLTYAKPPKEMADIHQQADRDFEHLFVCPGVFPACHATHTNNQYINGAVVVRRQSDPPNSQVLDVDPPPKILKDSYYCEKITIWNAPPVPNYVYNGVKGNAMKYQFSDLSTDPDWVMRPLHDFGFYHWLPPEEPPKTSPMEPYIEEFGVCPTCPLDGIQSRQWDFQNDGVIDQDWKFYGRLQKLVEAKADDKLYGGTPDYSAADVGRWVRGDCIQDGTTITVFNSVSLVTLSKPTTCEATELRSIIYKPYQPTVDNPSHTYPRPGNYNATLRICDHETFVRETPPIFGSRLVRPMTASSLTTADMRGFYGDPHNGTGPGAAWPAYDAEGRTLYPIDITAGQVAGSSYIKWNDSRAPPLGSPANGIDTKLGGTNFHACDTQRQEVRIPNTPPRLCGIPPNYVALPNSVVTFTVCAFDPDPGQTLTLRLCADQELPSGVSEESFPTVGPIALNQVSQVFTWNVGNLPMGRYGPICFEATDGYRVWRLGNEYTETTRGLTNIFISSSSQDTDLDGITDLADNCPATPNRDQADDNNDDVGDACELEARHFTYLIPELPPLPPGTPDEDQDSRADERDNCPTRPNSDQSDVDRDGAGDLCDADADGDGIVNRMDNCPTVENPYQADSDRNGRGDACLAPTAQDIILRYPSLRGTGDQEKAADATWPLVWGTALGIAAMAAVLVPLLSFALKRADSKRKP